AVQIGTLLAERYGDAKVFVARPSVWKTLSDIDRAQEAPRVDKAIADTRRGYDYRRILVVDRALQIIAPVPSPPLEPIERSALQAAIDTRGLALVDPHRLTSGDLVQGVVHPVFANDDRNNGVVGAVYLEHDCRKELFPLLELQPTSSASSETLLARREGDEIVFLSRLRFRPEALPLSFRLPVSHPSLARRALVEGEFGLLSGLDYRGVAVIGATQPVSGTPWVMVTKIDRVEVEQPARVLGMIIAALAFVLSMLLMVFFWQTWSRRSRELLRVSQERFNLFADTMPAALFIKDADRLIHINRYMANVLGAQARDWFGKTAWDLFPSEIAEKMTADDRQAMTVGCLTTEEQVPHEDGQVRLYETHKFRVPRQGLPPLLGGVAIDITARKQAEHDLQQSETRFRSYFDLPLVGIAITSLEKGWLEFNQRLCEIFGYPREELKCLTWVDITHPDDITRDAAEFERVLRGETDGYSLDKRFIRKDGTVIHAMISARCVRKNDGQIDYFVALIQDITAQKQAEAEVL
ncbi:MAG: PAS domain S-box protein, partial [Pseudomonadota bacterium]